MQNLMIILLAVECIVMLNITYVEFKFIMCRKNLPLRQVKLYN